MLSLDTSDVSSVPGSEVRSAWLRKLPAVGPPFPVEDAVPPEVLRADVGRQIRPRRILRIVGRIHRARSDVAEPAGHADTVRFHQVSVVVVAGIAVIAFRVPSLARLVVEVRVREQPQSDDSGGLAVVRPDGNRLAPRAPIFTPGYFVALANGIRRCTQVAHVEPQSPPVRIGSRGLSEARFVHEPELVPPVVARGRQYGMRRDGLEEVERPEALAREHVPLAIVAAGPHVPHVAALHLSRVQRQPAVHVVEIVLVGRRKRFGRPPGAHRFVEDGARLRLVRTAADESRVRPCDDGRRAKQF